MSDTAKGFDPHGFFEVARKIGHGRALGLVFRASGDNWAELALPHALAALGPRAIFPTP